MVASRSSLLAVLVLGVVTLRLAAGGPHAKGKPAPLAKPKPAAPATAAGCPAGMVHVAASSFIMGGSEPNENPRHTVKLSGYCIDKTEVTVAAYSACVSAGMCVGALTRWVWLTAGGYSGAGGDPANLVDPDTTPASQICNGNHTDRQSHPMNCVSWDQANAYCAWAKKRLPTEAEWEFAARGSDGREFPWGSDAPTGKKLNACGAECPPFTQRAWGKTWQTTYPDSDGWETTAPVGSYPDGASPFGALDMAGNVWEWVSDWYAPYVSDETLTDPKGPASGTTRSLRGGGFLGAAPFYRSAFRNQGAPMYRDNVVGFRCARGE